MVVNYKNISTKLWAPKVSSFGGIVADVEYIRQAIAMIVFTIPGSVPYFREFGCGMWDFLDKPAQLAGPSMVREIRNAVTKYEKNSTVVSCDYAIDTDGSLSIQLVVLPNFNRITDPESTVFIGFEIEGTSVYLVDNFGYHISIGGLPLTIIL